MRITVIGASIITIYKHGEVWLTKFVYDDDPLKIEVRPTLVISDDLVGCQCVKMTKHAPRDMYEHEIKYWMEAGLAMPTTIRTSKIIKLTDNIMVKKLGALQPYDLFQFQQKYIELCSKIL